jgi:hypothetical protein
VSIDDLRPADDPDYQRLVKVTEAIEKEIQELGPKRALGRRFDYEMTMRYSMRRTEETSEGVRLGGLDPDELSMRLGATWPEGFAFGALAYTQEHRGRKAEPFLDRVALANIKQALASAGDEGRSAIFSSIASTNALGFVSSMRSMKALQVLQSLASRGDQQTVKALLASHWLDGFFVGLVFEEFGGHRP